VTCRLLAAALRPLNRKIEWWLHHGELHDPFDEFFIVPSYGVEDSGYQLNTSPERLPSALISVDVAQRILDAGVARLTWIQTAKYLSRSHPTAEAGEREEEEEVELALQESMQTAVAMLQGRAGSLTIPIVDPFANLKESTIGHWEHFFSDVSRHVVPFLQRRVFPVRPPQLQQRQQTSDELERAVMDAQQQDVQASRSEDHGGSVMDEVAPNNGSEESRSPAEPPSEPAESKDSADRLLQSMPVESLQEQYDKIVRERRAEAEAILRAEYAVRMVALDHREKVLVWRTRRRGLSLHRNAAVRDSISLIAAEYKRLLDPTVQYPRLVIPVAVPFAVPLAPPPVMMMTALPPSASSETALPSTSAVPSSLLSDDRSGSSSRSPSVEEPQYDDLLLQEEDPLFVSPQDIPRDEDPLIVAAAEETRETSRAVPSQDPVVRKRARSPPVELPPPPVAFTALPVLHANSASLFQMQELTEEEYKEATRVGVASAYYSNRRREAMVKAYHAREDALQAVDMHSKHFSAQCQQLVQSLKQSSSKPSPQPPILPSHLMDLVGPFLSSTWRDEENIDESLAACFQQGTAKKSTSATHDVLLHAPSSPSRQGLADYYTMLSSAAMRFFVHRALQMSLSVSLSGPLYRLFSSLGRCCLLQESAAACDAVLQWEERVFRQPYDPFACVNLMKSGFENLWRRSLAANLFSVELQFCISDDQAMTHFAPGSSKFQLLQLLHFQMNLTDSSVATHFGRGFSSAPATVDTNDVPHYWLLSATAVKRYGDLFVCLIFWRWTSRLLSETWRLGRLVNSPLVWLFATVTRSALQIVSDHVWTHIRVAHEDFIAKITGDAFLHDADTLEHLTMEHDEFLANCVVGALLSSQFARARRHLWTIVRLLEDVHSYLEALHRLQSQQQPSSSSSSSTSTSTFQADVIRRKAVEFVAALRLFRTALSECLQSVGPDEWMAAAEGGRGSKSALRSVAELAERLEFALNEAERVIG
jgi:hypothetical protein